MTYLGINLKENNKIKKTKYMTRHCTFTLGPQEDAGMRQLEWVKLSRVRKTPSRRTPRRALCLYSRGAWMHLSGQERQVSTLGSASPAFHPQDQHWELEVEPPRAWDQGRWARGAGGIHTIHSIRLRICEQPGHLFGLFEATWTEAINPLLRLYAPT